MSDSYAMDHDEEIVPGLIVRIHVSAIDDGLVRIEDALGVPLSLGELEPDEEDGDTVTLNHRNIAFLTKPRRMVYNTRSLGGGWYSVKGDDSIRYTYSSSIPGDRQEAQRKAMKAAILKVNNES